MAMMAAEVLGIPIEQVRADRRRHRLDRLTMLTGGSRVTFATGMAAVQAAEKVVDELKQRAAMIWDIAREAVDWQDGAAVPAGANAGSFEPLRWPRSPLKAARTGGPISAEVSLNAQGAGPGFGDAYLRRRGGPGDRPRHHPALHRGPGCRQGDPSRPTSRARSRAAPPRASAGR